MASNYQTIEVLDESELQDGQMKQVDFGEGKVLLSKIGKDVHATSAFCTHYGAPLAKGVLVASGRVTCPWHGACFNVCSGDIEDAPAPAALHKFTTEVKNGKILVTADPEKTLSKNKSRSPTQPGLTTAGATPSDAGVVIVGGGAGAIATLVGLRESQYTGAVTILSAEPHAPIDRTKLSKALVTDASKLEWYPASEIKGKFGADLRTGATVSSVDVASKTVSVAGGEKVKYDKLILSTGATPRRLPIPGASLPHVFTLRSVSDAKKIDAALGQGGVVGSTLGLGKTLVIIGSSFIGMELAVAAGSRKLKAIHVIGMTSVPFEPVLGTKIGAALKKFHESKGVVFHAESKSTEITETSVTIEGRDGKKTVLDADVVVMAVGVGPATEFLQGSAIPLQKGGAVEVDEYFQVKGVKDVYAIGDIALFPEHTTGKSLRIEHWNVAQNHGRAAAAHIAGLPSTGPFDKTPVFWSAQGQQLRYVGHAAEYDDVYIQGDADALKFVAYYIKGDKVLAVSSMQSDPVAIKCSELLRLGLMPSASSIKGGLDPLTIDISTAGSNIKR